VDPFAGKSVGPLAMAGEPFLGCCLDLALASLPPALAASSQTRTGW
jgi:hypothetical protein